MDFKNLFKNKKILITGHTGFKGSWLTLILRSYGAKIIGISNQVISKPSFYDSTKSMLYKDYFIDIRDIKSLKKIIKKEEPFCIFHLAAQSLVLKSYNNPLYTFTTNFNGTLNILEIVREINRKIFLVCITSDKSYQNIEKNTGYKEDDKLGGFDPYSASKGSTELLLNGYFNSFFKNKNSKIKLAIARAGNVIGGGDWSNDRIVPDAIKQWSKNKTLVIRSPDSTRPWQHVFEPLSGYIILMSKLINEKNLNGEIFNFGPKNNLNKTVIELINAMNKNWSSNKKFIIKKKNSQFKESKLLKLNSNKAKKILNWECLLNFNETVSLTSAWYKQYYNDKSKILDLSIEQYEYYLKKND